MIHSENLVLLVGEDRQEGQGWPEIWTRSFFMDRHWNTRVGGGECGVFALIYLNEKTKNEKFSRDKKTFAQH